MLDHLTGEMRDTVTSRDLATPPLPHPDQPVGGIPLDYGECSLPLALPQPDLLTQPGPKDFIAPVSLPDGGTASNYPILDGGPEATTAPARTQSSGLLILDAQPPGLLQLTDQSVLILSRNGIQA